MTRHVLVFPDADSVAESTGSRLLLALADAIALRGSAHVVLTGGTVGIQLLARAAESPLAKLVDWTSVNVWWGDERFVATGHADRNEGQAQAALLRTLPLPEENIRRMGAEDQFADVEEAARTYTDAITAAGSPQWDVALFGMGPDGHVASLFPGHPVYEAQRAGSSAPDAVAVEDSPKPPPSRVSLSLQAINRAREVWIVAAGAEKAPAVADALRSDTVLPAGAVHGTERTLWLIDAAASTRV